MEYRYLMNGRSLVIDGLKCTGCGICRDVCPHGVFTVSGKAAIRDRELCMECGACALNCPRGAIAVNRGVGCAAAVLGSAYGRKGRAAQACCGKDGCGCMTETRQS